VHHSEAQTTVVAQRSAARSQAATELQRALPVRVRGEFPLASKEQRKNYLPSWVTKLAYRHWILRSSPFTHSLAQEAQLSALRLHQSVSQSVSQSHWYQTWENSAACTHLEVTQPAVFQPVTGRAQKQSETRPLVQQISSHLHNTANRETLPFWRPIIIAIFTIALIIGHIWVP